MSNRGASQKRYWKEEAETSMEHVIVALKKGEGRAFKAGGLWIYDNEIASLPFSAITQ